MRKYYRYKDLGNRIEDFFMGRRIEEIGLRNEGIKRINEDLIVENLNDNKDMSAIYYG